VLVAMLVHMSDKKARLPPAAGRLSKAGCKVDWAGSSRSLLTVPSGPAPVVVWL
jgi:hypothetical protein